MIITFGGEQIMVKCTCGNSFRNLTELKIHRHLQWPLTESMEKHKPDMSDASTRKAVNKQGNQGKY